MVWSQGDSQAPGVQNNDKQVDCLTMCTNFFLLLFLLRYSYNGNTSVFQTEARGSIPLYRYVTIQWTQYPCTYGA